MAKKDEMYRPGLVERSRRSRPKLVSHCRLKLGWDSGCPLPKLVWHSRPGCGRGLENSCSTDRSALPRNLWSTAALGCGAALGSAAW
jgi:hypothetical protein